MKPLIGITTYYVPSKEYTECKPRGRMDQDMMTLTADYAQSVERAGGIPILIPVYDQPENLRPLLERLDGLILSGGEDLDTSFYKQRPHPKLGKVIRKRDDHEMELLRHATELELPILAICRGHQVLNVFFGGTLIQDISSQLPEASVHVERHLPRWEGVHTVKIVEGGYLADIIQEKEVCVNSLHHQAIDKLGEGLVSDAVSPDGIIEAYHSTSYPKLISVQWHPEMMACCTEPQGKLFKYFVQDMCTS